MAKFIVNKTKDYTVMSNYHLKEKEMSLKAKGLLSLMLSLPSDWDYSIDGLVSICKENESAINSTLKELKDFGYLVVTKLFPNQTQSGRIEYLYDVYEKPTFKKQDIEKQDLENLGVENVGVEIFNNINSNILKNKELNNKEKNNKEKIKEIVEYLNEKTRKHYRVDNQTTIRLINALFNKKYTIENIKQVIDSKCKDWLGNDYEKYLRPETLFGNKFEGYLNSSSQEQESLFDKLENQKHKIDESIDLDADYNF